MAQITIDGSYNARWAVPSATEESVPWLARSASLDALSDLGRRELDTLGIALVLDLREDAERAKTTHGVAVSHVPLDRLPDGAVGAGSLEDAYDFLLTRRGPGLAAAVAVIATAPGPVLVHCTAGTNRTGLVIALALLASGHAPAVVVADYALSPSGADRVDSPHRAMEHAVATIHAAGGAEAYLIHHGATAAHLQSLRIRLGESMDE